MIDRIEEHSRRADITKFITHLIVISMLFLVPEFVMNYTMSSGRGGGGGGGMQWVMYAKSVIFIAVFYIDYYFVISRTLTPNVKVWRFIFYNLLILVGALGLSYLIWYLLAYLPRLEEVVPHHHKHNPDKFRMMFVSSMVRDGAMIILTMGLAVALRLSDRWAAMERHQRDMADEQRQSELRNLKSQLNPHFLFNTLNSIYALIEISPNEAQQAVHELSQMLRYMLYESPTTVSLKQETDFTRNYISLMELRFQPGTVNFNCDIAAMENTSIAPLLFISLIENAFKHGNTGKGKDLIDISITAEDGIVRCMTRNTFDSSTKVDRQGGIGIANLRRRLVLIYGDKASLSTVIEGDSYKACLEIRVLQ